MKCGYVAFEAYQRALKSCRRLLRTFDTPGLASYLT